MSWKPKDFEHGLCSICKKRYDCDMVEDMAYDGWDMVYKDDCNWFNLSEILLENELKERCKNEA